MEHHFAERYCSFEAIKEILISFLDLLEFFGQLLLHLHVVPYFELQSAHLRIFQLHFCVLQLVVLLEDLLFPPLFARYFLNFRWLRCLLHIHIQDATLLSSLKVVYKLDFASEFIRTKQLLQLATMHAQYSCLVTLGVQSLHQGIILGLN